MTKHCRPRWLTAVVATEELPGNSLRTTLVMGASTFAAALGAVSGVGIAAFANGLRRLPAFSGTSHAAAHVKTRSLDQS